MPLVSELAALIPLLNTFAPEVIKLLHMLESTPEEEHQKIMAKVSDAFNESKNNGRPGDL